MDPGIHLSAGARKLAIARIMEARFMLSAFEQIRDAHGAHWDSPGNSTARDVYRRALRERERLVESSDAQLCAELAELR